jgi:hypothetical protein
MLLLKIYSAGAVVEAIEPEPQRVMATRLQQNDAAHFLLRLHQIIIL